MFQWSDEHQMIREAVEFREARLRIEQLELARPARHEQEDHVLGFRRKVRVPFGERILSHTVGGCLTPRQ